MATLKDNAAVLREVDNVQARTIASLDRLQREARLTEELGTETLVQLREQRCNLDRVQMDAEDLNQKLQTSKRLQNRLDRWAGNWMGSRKRSAKREAANQIATQDRAHARATIGKVPAISDTKRPTPKNRRTKGRPRATQPADDQPQPLTAETRQGLEEVAFKDQEIDDMLDVAADSLDRLKELSVAMAEESTIQNRKMNHVAATVDTARQRQAVVNSRAQRSLVGRWARRANASNQ